MQIYGMLLKTRSKPAFSGRIVVLSSGSVCCLGHLKTAFEAAQYCYASIIVGLSRTPVFSYSGLFIPMLHYSERIPIS